MGRQATHEEIYRDGNIVHMPSYSILSLLTLLLEAMRIAYCLRGAV